MFSCSAHIFATCDKKKYIKKLLRRKEKKTWNKPKKSFSNKWKRKLAKSDKVSYYNQGKQVNEHDYGKEQYYNKYYNDDLDLITTAENSGSESEADSHNDSVPQEKNILVSLESLSTLASSFTDCKFC